MGRYQNESTRRWETNCKFCVTSLSHLFAARKISKIYLAIGRSPGDSTIRQPIARGPRKKRNRQIMIVDEEAGNELLHTRVRLPSTGKISLLLVRIETGSSKKGEHLSLAMISMEMKTGMRAMKKGCRSRSIRVR